MCVQSNQYQIHHLFCLVLAFGGIHTEPLQFQTVQNFLPVSMNEKSIDK